MNALKTGFLMSLLTVIFVLVGRHFGGDAGMLLAFGLAVAMNVGAYWFSDKVVLTTYKARELSAADAPELHEMVRELTERAGLPMPRLYLIPQEGLNAFATGRDPKHAAIAYTEGILRALPASELRGVTAHELAHVQHRDILISTIAATFAGAITMLATMARWAFIFGGLGGGRRNSGGIGALLMIFLAPVAAMVVQMAISRSREYAADAGAARISGRPLDLANALRHLETASAAQPTLASPTTAHLFIVSPRLGGLSRLFSTHPSIEDRVRRLEKLAGEA